MSLAETPEEQRAWMKQWRAAAIALHHVKREELRAMRDEDAVAAFNASICHRTISRGRPIEWTAAAWSSSNVSFKRRVPINHVFEAALELQRFCESQQYRFCFIGAVALQRWGDPRATQDADLTLLTGFGQEEHFISALIH